MQKGESIKLTGIQALHYIRIRQGLDDELNISRMNRQKQYIQSVFDTVRNKLQDNDTFFIN